MLSSESHFSLRAGLFPDVLSRGGEVIARCNFND